MQYTDLQIAGYVSVDFNQDDLSAEQLHMAFEAFAGHGVEAVLPMVVTERIELMCARLARLVELRERDPLVKRMTPGFHVEGPFINETDGYRGAHPRDSVLPANVDAAQRLLDAGGGLVKLLTLAPERDDGVRVTRMLAGQGVIVAGGHSDASRDQLAAAIDAGMSMWTHLGNGCPMQMHRHDNIIQRVLAVSAKLWVCFIADGVHVPFFALANYLRVVGMERAVVVTDSMAAAGMKPGRYKSLRWDALVGEDGAAWAPDRSHLLGAAITMPRTHENLTQKLGFSEAQAQQLLHTNPRRAMGWK